MKISFITLFPEFIEEFKNHSIIKKTIKENKVEIEIIYLRDYAEDRNKVDDYIYGGGTGMLLTIEPLVKAIESVRTKDSYVILLGPRGQSFTQKRAKQLREFKHLILISGHYEGVDARIKHFIDEEISLGDFIVTGGELASMILADAIIRLLPNVLKDNVTELETFEDNRLEYDQFSKPVDFRGYKVPEVLLSGNHKLISNWRRRNSIENTVNHFLKPNNKKTNIKDNDKGEENNGN